MTHDRTPVQSAVRVLAGTALLLAIPLVASRFTTEVVWSVTDYAIMGVLLAGTGLLYELATRRASSAAYRGAVVVGLFGLFLLVWANLAVGVIGSESNPANTLYLAVLAVALLGMALSRFGAEGMARTMVAAAVVQALIGVAALVLRLGGAESGPVEIVGVNALFVVLFLASATLFRKAAPLAQRRPA